jgi:DNA-binding transcriptional MerR regulator
MKIKELEQASGIPRASIRFYEKEGLLEPERMENGYREYSDGDLDTLKKILLLRTLQVPLKDIKALQAGEDELEKVLDRQISALGAQREALDKALRVCRELREARVDYRDLPAQKYLDSFDREPRAAVTEADRLPKVQAPVRRFFARELDLLLCSDLWVAFLALVCNVGVHQHRSGLMVLLDIAVPLLMMLLIEPLLLRRWGTTPGKWALGLSVAGPEGGRLRYEEGLSRTGKIIVRGMGLRLPVISLIRLWKSYRTCDDEKKTLSWEEESQLVLRDEKPWRIGAYIALTAAICGLLGLSFGLAGMPLHRGELTVAEFSDNFNRLARFHGCSFIYGGYEAELDENGLWTKRDGSENIFVPDILGGVHAPLLAIRTDGDRVTEVSFRCEATNPLPSSCQREMTLTAGAFACAQKGFGLFSRARRELLDAINGHPFESFEYSHGGIAVRCEVEYSGYRLVGGSSLFSTVEEAEDRAFSLAFSIRRMD